MTPTERLSQQIDGACIARMLDQYSKVRDGQLHHWKNLAIALESALDSIAEDALWHDGIDNPEALEDIRKMVKSLGYTHRVNQEKGDLENLKVHIPEHPTVLDQ